MSQVDGRGSPGSEDPDAMVAQIMNQFESSAIQASAASHPERPIDEPQLEAPTPPAAPMFSTLVEVAIPTINNIHEYEYLPGHFAIRRILHLGAKDPGKPSYTVRLQSGERATVSHSC